MGVGVCGGGWRVEAGGVESVGGVGVAVCVRYIHMEVQL